LFVALSPSAAVVQELRTAIMALRVPGANTCPRTNASARAIGSALDQAGVYGISPLAFLGEVDDKSGGRIDTAAGPSCDPSHPLALSLGSAGRFGTACLWTGCAVTRTRCGVGRSSTGRRRPGRSCRDRPTGRTSPWARARDGRRPAPVGHVPGRIASSPWTASTCTWCAASSAGGPEGTARVRPPGLLATGRGPGRRTAIRRATRTETASAVAVESNPRPTAAALVP